MSKQVQLLFLTGSSNSAKAWGESVCIELKKKYKNVHLFQYKNWSHQSEIDITYESRQLSKLLTSNKNTVVIAKSAGSLVFMQSFLENHISLPKTVLIGFPIEYAKDKSLDISDYLKTYDLNTLCIQAKNDPMGSYEAVSDLFRNNPNIITASVEGDDHNYANTKKLLKLIDVYLSDSTVQS